PYGDRPWACGKQNSYGVARMGLRTLVLLSLWLGGAPFCEARHLGQSGVGVAIGIRGSDHSCDRGTCLDVWSHVALLASLAGLRRWKKALAAPVRPEGPLPMVAICHLSPDCRMAPARPSRVT